MAQQLFPHPDDERQAPAAIGPTVGETRPLSSPLFPHPDDEARLRAIPRLTTTPDVAARVKVLQERTGLPPSVIERNLEQLEKEVKASELDPARLASESPSVAAWLAADQYNAATAADDLMPLTRLERAWRMGSNVVRALGAGAVRFNVGAWGLLQAGGELLGLEGVAEWGRVLGRDAARLAEDVRGPQIGAGFVEKGIYGGVESIGLTATALPFAIMGGGAPALLGVVGGAEGGASYAEARGKGVPPTSAALFGASQAAIEVATERLPAIWLLRDLQKHRGFLTTLARQGVAEVPGEQAATILQDLNQWAVLNPQKPFADYIAERPSAAASTLISTLVAVGGQTTVAEGAQAVLERISQAAEASETVKRAPGAVADLIDTAVAGEPFDAVHVGVTAFTTYYQEQGEDPVAVAARLTGDPLALPRALETGADLAIPLGRYVAEIAATPAGQAFASQARLSPETLNGEEQAQLEQAMSTELEAGQQQAPEEPSSAAEVRSTVEEMLQQAAFEPSTAGTYGKFFEAFFGSIGQRVGLDPLAIFQRRPLTAVTREGLGEAPNMPAPMAVDPSLDALEDDVSPSRPRRGETPAQREQRRQDHFAEVLAAVIRDAQRTDPSVNPETVREVFTSRLTALDDMRSAERDAGLDPRALLQAIAGYGGLSVEAEEGGYSGELRWLRDSPALGPAGSFGGVGGVFRRRDASGGLASTGLSLDDMVRMLSQERRFSWVTDINELLAALEDISREGDAVSPSDVFPGTSDLREVGVRLGRRWWSSEPDDFDPSFYQGDFIKPKGYDTVAPHLTDEERAKLRRGTAARVVEVFRTLPPDADYVAAARAGEAKRGWYERSGEALRTIFGDVDASRFTLLLAALSPRVAVEDNILNAINVWNLWRAAGRPTKPREIKKLLALGVRGEGTKGVLDSWINNTVTALSSEDPSSATLSGPKVSSFAANLRGVVDEVTNDSWMAIFANVEQKLFQGVKTTTGDPGKRPGYLAATAKIRRVAEKLTEETGKPWTPAEVQETVWSWAKTVYELAEAEGITAEEIVRRGLVTDAAITSTPDFAAVLTGNPTIRTILEAAGYGIQLSAVEAASGAPRGSARRTGAGRGRARATDRSATLGLLRAARRLDRVREARQAERIARGQLFQTDDDTYTDNVFGEALRTPGTEPPAAAPVRNVGSGTALSRDDVPEGTFATRTTLAVQHKRRLGASKVTTAAQAAAATEYLARGAVERVDFLVTDRSGKPLAVVGSYKGRIDQAAMHPGVVLAEAIRIPGAAAIWASHNHPSGVPHLSEADMQIARRFHELFAGTQIAFKGILAVGAGQDGGRTFEFHPTGQRAEFDASFETNFVPPIAKGREVPVLERELEETSILAPQLRGPDEAIRVVPKLLNGQFGVVMLDSHRRPVAALPVDPTVAAQLAGGGRVDWLYRAISIGNPASVIIASPDRSTHEAAYNMANALHNAELDVVDLLLEYDGVYVSEQARLGRPLTDYLKRSFRQGEDKPRGAFNFGPGGTFSIDLLKRANLSTFLHESGHYFLEVFGGVVEELETKDPATLTETQRRLLDDYHQLIVGWFKLPDVATWRSMDLEARRPYHEQFARGLEAYVREGKAPSADLRSAFARARAWLLDIYKSLRRLRVELTPEVRGVFDRMLATDDAIAAAQQDMAVAPLFTDEIAARAGLSPEVVANYREAVRQSTDRARERLQTELLRELQRERANAWRQARLTLRPIVAEEFQQQPVYRALALLQRGVQADGSPLAPGVEAFKLSKDALVAQFGPDILAKLPRPYVYRAQGGVPPAVAAELLGFESGTALVQALATARPIDEVIDQETDRRVRMAVGDILLDGRLAERAQAAVMDAGAEVFAAELDALASVVPGARARMTPVRAIRAIAERRIAETRLRDLRPGTFAAAARRAGTEALALAGKQDFAGALAAKQRQVLNVELHRASTNARTQVETAIAGFRSLFRPDAAVAKTYNVDLVAAARSMLVQFGLGRASFGDRTPSQYLEQVRKYDPELHADLELAIAAADQPAKPYRELTFDEFVALRDAVANLTHLARRSQQVLLDGRARHISDVRTELQGGLSALGSPHARRGYDRAMTKWEKTKIYLMGARAALRRVEHWVEAVDRGDTQGPFRRLLFTPISEAAASYRLAKRSALERYLEIVKGVEKSLATADIAAPEIGYTFAGKMELLHALLHTGNPSNLSKLLRGRNWAYDLPDGTLESSRWEAFIERAHREGILTKADYDYVQGVWDLNESLKPAAQRVHHDLYGYYFAEITEHPVVTPFGTYRGGYMPAIVDPFLASDAAQRADQRALEETPSSFMFPTAGRGFTKGRVEAYAKPLALDLRVVPAHLDQVLRFIHLEPVVKDAARVVTDKAFRRTLDGFDLTVAGELLVPWLQRAAKQTVDTPAQGWGGRGADRFWRAVRKRTGLQIMAGNVLNTLQQITGLSIAAVQVPPTALARALARYMRDPAGVTEMILEKDQFMATRTTTSTIEVQSNIDDLLLNPSTYQTARDFAQRHGYILQAFAQNMVDKVVWIAEYDTAIAEGDAEKAAVRRAASRVRQTQGSFNPEDLSKFETGTPAMRAFTMFYSYFNMQANLLGTEFARAARELGLRAGAGRMLYVYTFGFLMPALISELIVGVGRGEWGDDDDDDTLAAWLAWFFASQQRAGTALVPWVGQAVNAGINTFNARWYDDRINVSPAVTAIESSVRAPKSVYEAIANDGRKKNAIRDTLTLVGLLTGLPVAPLGRPIGYLADVAEGEVKPDGPVDLVRGLVTGR